MKTLLPALLLALGTPAACYAQAADSVLLSSAEHAAPSGCARVCDLSVARGTETVAALAEQDIRANTPYLIVLSGEAITRIPTQASFEKHFHVQYRQVGCLVRSVDEAIEYNNYTFAYLQTTYGKAWQQKAWADVAGLDEWKRSH